ncbi:hypothetical protein C8Q73DRAFT_633914 [Cubamyces lactineus]|nr:hypothetical protein C8Q73DRAFT_633914 [Cubamyces lactineus]
MLPSTATVEPPLSFGAPVTRSDSFASSVHSTGSGASLQRRSRTRTRSLVPSKRDKSTGRSASSKYESDAGESFLDLDDAPPVPKLLHDEPEEIHAAEREVRRQRRRSRTIGPEGRTYEGLHPGMSQMARSWSALDIRDPPEQGRGRQAKSDTGSFTTPKARLRGLSLPRQSFRQNAHSDSSSQPSPQTPYGFGDGPAVRVAGPSRNHFRDSILTQISATSSSVYPASTSAGTRTESSMPYTEDQDEGDMSYPDIVSPEGPDFDPDDVSYRLRLLLNNSYFLPPAHAKPTPMALSPHPQDAQKSKPATSGFLDFFRIGKAKSKPTSPVPGSPPAVDSNGPILRTTSDSPSASGLLLRVQTQPLSHAPAVPPPCPPPASRVVVLRERMDDLATAAKEAEKEIRSKADGRKPKTPTAPRDRYVDDVIDPTDAVDLPPPSADALFAVQASAMFGLGPQDSVGAAVLADRLVPSSPGMWSISSEEESWRKELLREAVSHSLGNTPDSSFTSSDGRMDVISPPPQSEATFPTPAILEAQRRVGQRILEDISIRTAPSEPSSPTYPVQPLTVQVLPAAKTGPPSFLERSPKALEHPLLTAADPPVRAETPAHMHTPLAPAPRKQLVNPLYSLSEPDLPDSISKAKGPSSGSSEATFHTVRKAASTPRMSSSSDASTRRVVSSLSPPPIPEHPEIHRGLSPAPRNLEGMPSFTRSRTESDSRYSDDSMSFRTPMDTDIELSGARPSMTISIPSGRPSISVSEYSAPSPTASAFRDAVFGSCRPPSSLSRRSATSIVEPLQSEVSRPPPVTPRSAAMSPPPRLSSSVSPTVLPPPPRPPAIRPTYRPSVSTHDSSQSPGAQSGPSDMLSSPSSDVAPVQDVSVQFSQSSSSASSSPLAERRGQSHPLSLQIPSRYDVPAIHSAPAPSSPTDFFDRIQSTIANAMDDLETSDESSDEELSLEGAEHARSRYNPPPPPRSPASEPVETAQVFVEPRTQAISNRASSSSSRPSIMRLGNHSTPQLSPAPSFVTAEPVPQFTFDRKKPIGNVADMTRRSFTSMRSVKSVKKGKGIMNVPNKSPILPIGAVPSSPINPYALGAGVSSSSVGSGSRGDTRRPATAPSEAGRLKPDQDGGRRIQRESIQKFDGMLLQHLAAERDRIKQITSNISNSNSAASSPVQTHASGHPFAAPSRPPSSGKDSQARSKSRSRSRPRAKTSS